VNKILVLFAHPNYQKSVLNKSLNNQYIDMPNITFHDLYEEYPNFIIDIQREQSLLDAHNIVIFQHPLYWYSYPALMKEWIDTVFQHGYAYGEFGHALNNKTALSVVTSGADSVSYLNKESIRNVMQPFERTVHFCNMHYLPPFVIHGGLKIKSDQTDPQAASAMLTTQVKLYKHLIRDLINDDLSHQELENYNTLNEWYIQSGERHD